MYTFFKESSNSKYVLQDFDHFKLEDDLRFMFSSKIFVNTRTLCGQFEKSKCVQTSKICIPALHRQFIFEYCF